MNQIKLTGGAKIGMVSASWPFAILKVSRERLDLNATIVGRYVFRPGDIVSVEPYGIIPVIGRGIKINHRVPNYKKKVIFWSFVNPDELIRRIRQTGFLDNTAGPDAQTDDGIVTARQKQGGFPIRVPYAIAAVVIWNVLFMIDFIDITGSGTKNFGPGKGVMAALGFLFFASVLLLISKKFRKLVLKEGRDLEDISRFLYFIIFISGFMLLSFISFAGIQ
jgi:hypothetical protein